MSKPTAGEIEKAKEILDYLDRYELVPFPGFIKIVPRELRLAQALHAHAQEVMEECAKIAENNPTFQTDGDIYSPADIAEAIRNQS